MYASPECCNFTVSVAWLHFLCWNVNVSSYQSSRTIYLLMNLKADFYISDPWEYKTLHPYPNSIDGKKKRISVFLSGMFQNSAFINWMYRKGKIYLKCKTMTGINIFPVTTDKD